MRRTLIASVAALALMGAGCASAPPAPSAAPVSSSLTYASPDYGFSLAYPSHDEVHVRETTTRQTTYLGQKMDFFASVRDLHRTGETQPVSMAYVYADKGLTVDAFKRALEASDPNVAVKSTENLTINGTSAVKMTSTTDAGIDKVHYLIDRNGTLLVFSVFLNEDVNFRPIFNTIRF